MLLLKRVGLALAATLLILLVLEVVVRVAGVAPPPRPLQDGRGQTKVDDGVMRYRNLPGGKVTWTLQQTRDSEPYQVVENINSLGLRGVREIRPTKPDGVLRVACVGDSFTYGHGVNDDETWPHQLEQALATRLGVGRVEVLNFGVSAYEITQEVRQIETMVMRFDPDLVLLCWFFNDPALREGPGFEMEEAPWVVRTFTHRPGSWHTLLRERSHLADTLIDRIFTPTYYRFYARTRSSLYDKSKPSWEKSVRGIRRAQAVTAAAGVDFAMLLYPVMRRIDGKLISHDFYRQVVELCDELGIVNYDLEPVFDGYDVDALRVHAYNAHPNGEAHGLVGEAVADFILAQQLLPVDAPR